MCSTTRRRCSVFFLRQTARMENKYVASKNRLVFLHVFSFFVSPYLYYFFQMIAVNTSIPAFCCSGKKVYLQEKQIPKNSMWLANVVYYCLAYFLCLVFVCIFSASSFFVMHVSRHLSSSRHNGRWASQISTFTIGISICS